LAGQVIVSRPTAALQSRSIAGLAAWLQAHRISVGIAVLIGLPGIIDRVVEAYGEVLYSDNVPLYVFVSLVTSLQRLEPALRHKLDRSWDIIQRWEKLEPYNHRPPVPIALVKALVVGAIFMGWPRWACATALAFWGPARIGEVLKSRRRDLCLGCDTLGETRGRILIHVADPKSGNRGGARRQHFTVRHPGVVSFVEAVFAGQDGDVAIYPFSSASYRSRWDRLLKIFQVPASERLLPGGLRGGGAVAFYTDDMPVPDLLWRMRLRHAVTLEHYLQEVAAVTTLASLGAESRSRIQLAAAHFDAVLSAQSRAYAHA